MFVYGFGDIDVLIVELELYVVFFLVLLCLWCGLMCWLGCMFGVYL